MRDERIRKWSIKICMQGRTKNPPAEVVKTYTLLLSANGQTSQVSTRPTPAQHQHEHLTFEDSRKSIVTREVEEGDRFQWEV